MYMNYKPHQKHLKLVIPLREVLTFGSCLSCNILFLCKLKGKITFRQNIYFYHMLMFLKLQVKIEQISIMSNILK